MPCQAAGISGVLELALVLVLPEASCGMQLWMRRQGSCSAHRSPGLHFLGSPSLLSDLAHALAPAWTTSLLISALSLSLFQLFVWGGNVGECSWSTAMAWIQCLFLQKAFRDLPLPSS